MRLRLPSANLRAVLLFLLTLLFTLLVGIQYHLAFRDLSLPEGTGFFAFILGRPELVLGGLAYSLSLLGILLVHEMGHFLACRRHGINASLPYFIPAPTLIGTFGAFIRIRSPFYSPAALFDVGLAGPLAGFIIALPLIFLGLGWSRSVPAESLGATIKLGEPLIFSLLAQPFFSDLPADSVVLLHPVAFAGWFGILATAFNLFPIGQLDGGHIVYALFGPKSFYLGLAAVLLLMLLGILFWPGWLFWALVITLFGLRHPPLPASPPLDRGRKGLALLALLVFLLSFTPAPVSW